MLGMSSSSLIFQAESYGVFRLTTRPLKFRRRKMVAGGGQITGERRLSFGFNPCLNGDSTFPNFSDFFCRCTSDIVRYLIRTRYCNIAPLSLIDGGPRSPDNIGDPLDGEVTGSDLSVVFLRSLDNLFCSSSTHRKF
jgi:hypothetical protein